MSIDLWVPILERWFVPQWSLERPWKGTILSTLQFRSTNMKLELRTNEIAGMRLPGHQDPTEAYNFLMRKTPHHRVSYTVHSLAPLKFPGTLQQEELAILPLWRDGAWLNRNRVAPLGEPLLIQARL